MIYIHVPYCKSFCTYCAFYSEIAAGACFKGYVKALCEEIERRQGEDAGGVKTLYFGGGTPSLLSPEDFGRIVKCLKDNGFGGEYEEFTVEVNPEDIVEKGEEYVKALLDLGVNRVSMGVQSFDDKVLRWMNRRHDSASAIKAYEILRRCGVRNISLDLIFGYGTAESITGSQDASDHDLRSDLAKTVELSPEHISVYQLSVEEGSSLYEMQSKGKFFPSSEDFCSEQYSLLCSTLALAGYRHYEVSNFCVPGFEAKHNSGYWSAQPYLGFGAGAHSYDGKTKRSWNSEMRSDGKGGIFYDRDCEILSAEDMKVEKIMLSLRTAEGLEASYLPENTASEMLKRGLLEARGDCLVIPESKLFVSDDIIAQLI